MPSKENQSRFFRPGVTWLTVTDPVAPWSVAKITTAPSSVAAVWPSRTGWAFAVRAATRVIRWPVTNSIRSHQCTPMSPKAREAPPSAGSTRQLDSPAAGQPVLQVRAVQQPQRPGLPGRDP